ncbi:MAG: zf-HC2 domain-containing protein [Acidobacteriota bacterium]|nr:zf-HC2 domain-containing protein [Acidobacteriota bacterium]
MTRRPPDAHCSIELDHWSRYVDGEFSSRECRRCEAHLESCAECRARLRSVEQTIRACRDAGRVTMPSDVRSRARQRVKDLLAREPAAPAPKKRSTRA